MKPSTRDLVIELKNDVVWLKKAIVPLYALLLTMLGFKIWGG
jgi:hypothetical protein